MRTAIYVHKPSTVTIRAKNPDDARVELSRYTRAANRPAIGVHRLEAGIYQVVSRDALEVTGDDVTVEATSGSGKDIFPDPKAGVIALEPGATAQSIQEFFALAKDV